GTSQRQASVSCPHSLEGHSRRPGEHLRAGGDWGGAVLRIGRLCSGRSGMSRQGAPALPLVTETLPLAEAFRHMVLPTADHDPSRLDHVTVYAAEGFGPDELAAFQAVRELLWGEGELLQVRLVGLG